MPDFGPFIAASQQRTPEEPVATGPFIAASDVTPPRQQPPSVPLPDIPIPDLPPDALKDAVSPIEMLGQMGGLIGGEARHQAGRLRRGAEAFVEGLPEASAMIESGVHKIAVAPPERTIEQQVGRQLMGALEIVGAPFHPFARASEVLLGEPAGQAAREAGAPENLARGVERGFTDLPFLALPALELRFARPAPGTIPRSRVAAMEATIPKEAPRPVKTGPFVAATPEAPPKFFTLGPGEGETLTRATAPTGTRLGSRAISSTGRGTAIESQYAVVDARDLIASHDTALRPNPRFPAELQPRERGRAASAMQLKNFEERMVPSAMGESHNVGRGAPIVGEDLVVESGNMRTIGLNSLYEKGHANAGRYKEWLTRNAEDFGLKPDEVQALERPVLVRIRQTAVDRNVFVQEANAGVGAAMSATEVAKVDATRLTGGIMDLFQPGETGEILVASNRDFMREFLDKVVPPKEVGRYIDATGQISQEGVLRVRSALFAKVFDDPGALTRLAESTDSNIRGLTNSVLRVVPRMARMKEAIARGRAFNYDISGDVSSAMNKLAVLRDEGMTVPTYLRQGHLFSEELTPLSRDILSFMHENARRPRMVSDTLDAFMGLVEEMGSPQQVGMFGAPAVDKHTVFDMAKRIAAGERIDPSQVKGAIAEGQTAPTSAASAGVARGAEITSKASVPPGTQAEPFQVSTRPPPSVSSTIRASTPPEPGRTLIPPTTRFTVGAIEPTSKRMVLQTTDDVNRLLSMAEEAKPTVDRTMQDLVQSIPGTRYQDSRVKSTPRLTEKIQSGKPSQTISDYLAARIAVDDAGSVDALVSGLEQRGLKVVLRDDFLEAPRFGGYRAVHLNAQLPSGLSVEVQVVPREIAEIQPIWWQTYAKWRAKASLTAEEMAIYERENTESIRAFDEAFDRFNRRNSAHGKISEHLQAEPALAAQAIQEGRTSLGLDLRPIAGGARGPFAGQATQVAAGVRSTATKIRGLSEKARLAVEQAETIQQTGTITKEARPGFRVPKPASEEVLQAFKVSADEVKDMAAELVASSRKWKRLKRMLDDFGDMSDPMVANTTRAIDNLMETNAQRVNQAVETWRKQRFAANRIMMSFNKMIPEDVIQAMEEMGVMVDRLKAVRQRDPIYTNIVNSLKKFNQLNPLERRQLWRDVVDAWRLNLFSVTSWTLDLVGNTSEVGTQVVGGVGRDVVQAGRGHVNFPSMQGLFRAVRQRAKLRGQAMAPALEEAFGQTVGGELVRGKIGRGPGIFTLRQTPATKTIDYVVGGPLYAKGIFDTGAKRLMATASIWRDAIESANTIGVRGWANRRAFYDRFMQNLPDDVIQRAISAGNKAGFNRQLSRLEEGISRSLGFRLLGDVFARWPFQFSRTLGEWVGVNPEFFRKVSRGVVTAEEIGEYVAKSASGWGGLYLIDNTLYDNVDFNSMEYVHEDGARTRLSNRDPIPTVLWLLATVKGDVAKSTAALRHASIPFARLLSGEGGLLGSIISTFRTVSKNADVDARAMQRELTDMVNRTIPGQAVLAALKTVFDPVTREGVGANLPGVSLALPAAIERTTGEPLRPRQRIPGINLEIPAIGGTPIPGAQRLTDPVFNLLSRFGLLVYRGPRSPIAGVPPSDLPRDLQREWEAAFGRHRNRLLLPLAHRTEALDRRDPDRARAIIQERDARAAKLATREIERLVGERQRRQRQLTVRERRLPETFLQRFPAERR